ncbi:MAG: 50S ribosomal protein L24 [Cytophagales bacterium]
MAKQNIKKGDKVVVLAGNARGKVSTVLQVLPRESRILVEGVNKVKRHLKPTSSNPSGSILEKELPVHISNVALADTNGKATRVGHRIDKEGNSERFSVKTGNVI